APCLASRVTTGIAIDAQLLPVIDAAEQLVWRQLKSLLPLTGVRCRIKPNGVCIQLESADAFDASSPFYPPLINAVQALFGQRGYAEKARSVAVEPYQRGSAFLVDSTAGTQLVNSAVNPQHVGSPANSQQAQ
ncbi:MAG: hypothetical protein ACR2PJ_03235, partial [Pseudomonadales bacterium]